MKYNPDNYRMTYKTVADTTLGCFLVVVRAQLSDDSRKRVLGLRFRITIFYNIVLFGDVPL